jgi:NAD(P)-dependent dehydrogenase (short-subunit alcohol dehydrogenase family)
MGEILKGKRVVITGAGGGIGRATALAMADEGACMVVNDVGVALDGTGGSNKPADDVVDEIKQKGGKAVPNYDSVTDYESAGKIIKTCIDAFGGIDILVNNAGISIRGTIFDLKPEDFDAVIKVHLYGAFYCSKHACTYMKQQKWGRILSATSDAYRGTGGTSVNYSAAKGGIASLMRMMAIELAAEGITCNAYAPGAGTRLTKLTDEYKRMMKSHVETGIMPRETYDRMVAGTPGPEYVAPLLVYLASDYGSKISGATIGIAGGRLSLHKIDEAKVVYKDYRQYGPWTLDELKRVMPKAIEANCPPPKGIELDWG